MRLVRDPRASRALALGLLALAVALPWSVLVAPALGRLSALEEETGRARSILAGYRSLAAGQGAAEARLDAVRRAAAEDAGFLSAGTPALAAAAMQGTVKAAVERHGGELRSVQALPPAAEDGFTRVGIAVEVAVGVDGLRAVLAEIAGSRDALLVRALSVRAPEDQSPGGGPALVLGARIEIHGYMRGAS